jgi:hypothetical protein
MVTVTNTKPFTFTRNLVPEPVEGLSPSRAQLAKASWHYCSLRSLLCAVTSRIYSVNAPCRAAITRLPI